MTSPRLVWVRSGDRYPDLKDEADSFIALDGEEMIGVVKLVPAPAGKEWIWSMLLIRGRPSSVRRMAGQRRVARRRAS